MLKNLEYAIPVSYKSTWIDSCRTPMDSPAFKGNDSSVVSFCNELWYLSLRELFQPTED